MKKLPIPARSMWGGARRLVGERLEPRWVMADDALVGLQILFHPVEMNGIAYFSGTDPSEANFELWRTDGTPEGTRLVKEIRPGLEGSGARGLANVNGTLFFAANDGVHGRELWKSDGTEAGTVMVRDVAPGIANPYIYTCFNVNGTVFFAANDGVNGHELWKSDGTAEGTVLVKDIAPGAGSALPGELIIAGSTVFFTANDGIHGRELWRTDGTANGTALVKDIRPTPISGPSDFHELNGMLLFAAHDGVHATELWRSDGTEAGTVMVKEIKPGSNGGLILQRWGVNVNGTLFFDAEDGAHGVELWKSDGTEAGTVLVKDIHPTVIGRYPQSSYPHGMVNANGSFLFGAEDSEGHALWTSDGTAVGTTVVKRLAGTIGTVMNVGTVTNIGGTMFFSTTTPETGDELWKSDGTEAGTMLVKDLLPGPASSSPRNFVNVGGTLFFNAGEDNARRFLWKSDGTEAGTAPVVRLVLPPNETPVVSLDAVPPLTENRSFVLSGSFSDADSGDSWTATVDFGDGSGEQPLPLGPDKRFALAHTYAANGTFLITVRVRDAAGAEGTAQTSVFVAPRPIGTSLNAGVLELNGSEQRDNLAVRLSGSRIIVNATYGSRLSNLSFPRAAVQRIVADLGAGDDCLRVDARLRQRLIVDAGAGNDRVYAGGGPSLILGGEGNDLLYGGSGRDVLIGGWGRDQLWGYGGSDLLISGRTSYDGDEAALMAVMAEWVSWRGFWARVSNLRSGSGPVLAGSGVRLVRGETVFQDAESDLVMGSGDVDWFFMELGRDINRERRKGEAVN